MHLLYLKVLQAGHSEGTLHLAWPLPHRRYIQQRDLPLTLRNRNLDVPAAS